MTGVGVASAGYTGSPYGLDRGRKPLAGRPPHLIFEGGTMNGLNDMLTSILTVNERLGDDVEPDVEESDDA